MSKNEKNNDSNIQRKCDLYSISSKNFRQNIDNGTSFNNNNENNPK